MDFELKISLNLLEVAGFNPCTQYILLSAILKVITLSINLTLIALTILNFIMVDVDAELLLGNLESMATLLQVLE